MKRKIFVTNTRKDDTPLKVFTTELKIRVYDLNYGGHLANDRVLALFQEARVQYLNHLGCSEGDIGDGVSLTQVEAHIVYKGEAFLGDVLRFSLWIDKFTRTRFHVNYLVERLGDGKLIATGYTVLAGFSYKTHRPQRIPQGFKDKVLEFQQEAR